MNRDIPTDSHRFNEVRPMGEAIRNLTGPEFIGLVAVLGGLLTLIILGIIVVGLPLWTWSRRVESTNQLKQNLAAAGFTPDEIIRVVNTPASASQVNQTTSSAGG
jgi:hypothetical protein